MKKLILFLLVIIALFTGCSDNPTKHNPAKKTTISEISDFDTFFKKFKTDSVYQVSHVKFPFSITIGGDDEDGDSVSYIGKSKWHNITFKKDKNNIYKQSQLSKTEVPIQHMVEDTGISSFFNFLYRNGKWQLVSFKDQSD
ncbi:DUF4348 domain-containing protein [Mucilaginibacter rigui]|uniref:DUF4348 domain-containing protein n=1 Tax=Mucilaginibacter rigui TaxID=534635 RepID=A0ABR7XAH2_9SPHI|nr:DUF4348 domain-containing protein [Mucilaginibacter rigui]MBD1387588.1 DUF4348 domain-containing protein [Mucilaginibacter rigui]